MSGSVNDSVTGIRQDWPSFAVRILLAVCRRAGGPNVPVRYAPADWLAKSPTLARRKRWSRWTRRLAEAGLLERLTEPSRDRVTAVRVTEAGWRWVREQFGPGALVELECEPLSIDGPTIEWELLPLES